MKMTRFARRKIKLQNFKCGCGCKARITLDPETDETVPENATVARPSIFEVQADTWFYNAKHFAAWLDGKIYNES